MIETHRISNFVRDIVHTRRAVALGRVSAKNAEEVYVAYLDSVMVRSKAQSPGSRKAQVSKLRQTSCSRRNDRHKSSSCCSGSRRCAAS
jgi:hypothetical protein